MADPETEKKTSSVMLDCSLLPDSVSPSAKMVQPATKENILSVQDWSFLPEELLQIISEKVDCFDAIHARSVCTLWRSIFPFPSCLLRTSYSLPSLAEFPYESEDFRPLEKIPLFLFRVRAPHPHASHSEYFLGGICRDDSEGHTELPSPLQCSVKLDIPGSDPTLMNMVDSQIIPLGHHYRMDGCNPKEYRGAAFIPLNKEGGGGGEFVVLLNYTKDLLVLRSAEMRWMRLKETSYSSCSGLVAFRGRFYANFCNKDIFIFDPYSLKRTPLMPQELVNCGSCNYLVPYGDDELFLVERIIPRTGVISFSRQILRVSRLDEEAGKWVEVSELGNCVLFIGDLANVSCSAKELPDGCGVRGNSIVFTNEPGYVTSAYEYGVDTGRPEDDLNCWRSTRKNRVTMFSTSPVVGLRVER